MRPAILSGGAGLALMLGLLVYATDRDPMRVALMPAAAALSIGPVFGASGHWLPSFVHPLAFSLLWAATRPANAPPAYRVCAGWWALNVAFEAGQHPRLSVPLAGLLHDIGGDSTRWLATYFVRGTFDVGDLVAATLGALVAAAVLFLVNRHSGRGDER